jgi:methionyl-tRNA formyltransferase
MYDIVFMGTPDFAVPALEALAHDPARRYRLLLVCTRPNAASARGKTLLPSPVRVAAEALGIPLTHDPTTLPPCDFIVVAAYGAILSPELIAHPRHGCINIHASLLPRWRGAAPIQRAILAKDTQMGVSIMRVVYELDAGPYCAQQALQAGEKSVPSLTSELARSGARLLVQTLPLIAKGQVHWVEQEPALVTYAAKIAKGELALNPELSAANNLRRIRASTPQAPARCHLCGRSVTVLEAHAFPSLGGAPGTVVLAHKRLFLTTAEGAFELLSLKPDGKQAMSAAAFSAGLRDAPLTWSAL